MSKLDTIPLSHEAETFNMGKTTKYIVTVQYVVIVMLLKLLKGFSYHILKKSTYFKKQCPLVGNSPKNFFYCFFSFLTRKKCGLKCFSLDSRVKLKIFEASPRIFSILPKNLMKNIEIHIFLLLKTK